ncbi:type 1 glutamine amidotransferase domain-containing protein [Gordonia sp. (in: high G+C Gram-positive bacteria)]|uniref:type 1 glutamine amidotransferase domain-containing protein n=1 Tax=Gordonia sp. (in: high G+C Gram-positive bacteria) TaxID=84139 RepID=UPI003340D143
MIVIVLPSSGYDPTESAIPWKALKDSGIDVRFATPNGHPAYADERLVEGGFSVLSSLLMTRNGALEAYREMIADECFLSPNRYNGIDHGSISGVFVPGGHASGMKTMLESRSAQELFANAILAGKPCAAVCHGVLLAARAKDPATGLSVLHRRHTTAVTSLFELSAWAATWPWLGNYYRTYNRTVQHEVVAALAQRNQFHVGPKMPRRDALGSIDRGFTVIDQNYISGRWPGDCFRLAEQFRDLVLEFDEKKSV